MVRFYGRLERVAKVRKSRSLDSSVAAATSSLGMTIIKS
jgi:hypothetical protein